MATNDPVIVAVGIVSAVGLSAKETVASVRSATMRFTETPLRDQALKPFVVAEIPDAALPELDERVRATPGLTSREMRLLRIGSVAIDECLTPIAAKVGSVGVVLALPEFQLTRRIDAVRFLQLLALQTGERLDLARSDTIDSGRAGGLVAIARAGDLIRDRKANFMLAGGIDTYRDVAVLATLDKEKRVKSALHLDGFVPGEGAVFLMLASSAAAAAAGLAPVAGISRVAESVEVGHLYSDRPYLGEGLAAAVAQLVQVDEASAPFAEVWSSMNGESHWGKEWGVTLIRNRAAFLDDHAIRHPADCLGDIGAAAGPMMVGLSALGMRDGHARSPALVYCSSDRGARAAIALRRS